MDEPLGHIGIFFLVDGTVIAYEVPGSCIGKQILKNSLVASVDVLLCALGYIHIAEATGSTLHAEQGVEHIRIQAVVIPAIGVLLRLILRSE